MDREPQLPDETLEPAEPVEAAPPAPGETGGPAGPEPTRYGDWEKKGIAVDF